MSPAAACDLCGGALGWLPRTGTFRAVPKRFCCTGCLNVYAILVESGGLEPGMDPGRPSCSARASGSA